MADNTTPSGLLPDNECREWSDACGGTVRWQVDGAKRCDRHQFLHERDKRRQMLASWAIAAVVIVACVLIVNAVNRPEEGPSQAKAWDVCHEYAADTLPVGAEFAQLPADPSERVKLAIASDLYRVYSYYELADGGHRDFACTVRYLRNDNWEVDDLTVAP